MIVAIVGRPIFSSSASLSEMKLKSDPMNRCDLLDQVQISRVVGALRILLSIEIDQRRHFRKVLFYLWTTIGVVIGTLCYRRRLGDVLLENAIFGRPCRGRRSGDAFLSRVAVLGDAIKA